MALVRRESVKRTVENSSESLILYAKNQSNRLGTDYELKVSLYFIKRLSDSELEFFVATEKEEDLKFEDLYVEVRCPEKVIYLMQLKHVEDVERRIAFYDLNAPEKGIYSLYKYFNFFCEIKDSGKYDEDWENLRFVICTTIFFDQKSLDSKNVQVIEENESEGLFAVDKHRIGSLYKLKIEDDKVKKELFKYSSSNYVRLARILAECALEGKCLDTEQEAILKCYHVALAEEVIDTENSEFQKQFLDLSKKLSPKADNFREVFYRSTLVYLKEKRLSVCKIADEEAEVLRNTLKDFDAVLDKGINDRKAKKEFFEKLRRKKLKMTEIFGKLYLENALGFAEEFSERIRNAHGGVIEVDKSTAFGRSVCELIGCVLVPNENLFRFNEKFLVSESLPKHMKSLRERLKAELGNECFYALGRQKFTLNFAAKEEKVEFETRLLWDLDDPFLENRAEAAKVGEFLDKLFFLKTPKEEYIGESLRREIEDDFGGDKGISIYNRTALELEKWIKSRDDSGKCYFLSKKNNPYTDSVKWVEDHENRVAEVYYQKEVTSHVLKLRASLKLRGRFSDHEESVTDVAFSSAMRSRHVNLLMKVLETQKVTLDFDLDVLTDVTSEVDAFGRCESLLLVMDRQIGPTNVDVVEHLRGSTNAKWLVARTLAGHFLWLVMKILYDNNGLPYKREDVLRKEALVEALQKAGSKLSPLYDERSDKQHVMFEEPKTPIMQILYVFVKYGDEKGKELLLNKAPDLYYYFDEYVVPDCLRYLYSLGYDLVRRQNS